MVKVTKKSYGLIVKKKNIMGRTHRKITTGVGEVQTDRRFWIFIRTFGSTVQNLPKIIVMKIVNKRPLTFMEV